MPNTKRNMYHPKYGYIYGMPEEDKPEHIKLIDKYYALVDIQKLLFHFGFSKDALDCIRSHNNKVLFNRKY